MAREWLNMFVDQSGNSPATQWIDASNVVQFNGKAVRIFETDRSGGVVIVNSGAASYGDSEVYLKINFSSGGSRYLSAPLHTPLEVIGVASIELHILFLAGPAGSPYRALVNAHCVYEVL